MVEIRNATYLTKKYGGREQELWTPCINNFLTWLKKPTELPISIIVDQPPWYVTTPRSLHIANNDVLLYEKCPDDFIAKIEQAFKVNLKEDLRRYKDFGGKKCDITGIAPDFLIVDPSKGVFILENKPYDAWKTTGNQYSEGDYVNFILWLNEIDNIHAEYLFIHSAGIGEKETKELKKIQNKLGDLFGSILLEDVFSEMSKTNFTYPEITENWANFTFKG